MEHTYKPFDTDIDSLRTSVTLMGGLVERQIVRAVDAVRGADLGLVAQVLADESRVNELHLQTDLRCNQVIAKRQPIAVDLREIIAVLHINNDLERIGDEAKKIALKAKDLGSSSLPLDVNRIASMAANVCAMLKAAIDAFIAHDTSVAAKLEARDDDVDEMRDELITDLIKCMSSDPVCVSHALLLTFIVQSIERVGDHAKNIAEYVVTVVEGVAPRHQSIASPPY
ncbi:MAG: phosphate signaling complex protein PhoU [Burkholderiaceae bacterium]